jgi:thiosulfate dehydrogenase [quinone] large subunit
MSAHTVTPTAAPGAGRATGTVAPAAVLAADERTRVTTERGRVALAVLRIATGFIFLWAFLDKTFGLGFSTPVERAWINGGTPAQGFLTSPSVTGPLTDFFAGLATPLVDVLFMLAMLGIGVAVILGIGLRVSAVVGTGVMLLMYLAEWPFTAGAESTNPLVDYHIVYALALIAIACLSAGDTFGLGRAWCRLTIVQKQRWLV